MKKKKSSALLLTNKASGVSIYSEGDMKADFEKLEKLVDIKNLPPELHEELSAVMSRPDFEPAKLIEAIERARAEQEEKEGKEDSPPERCPWYVSVCRIVMFLGCVAFLFAIFWGTVWAGLIVFDNVTGNHLRQDFFVWASNHPVIAVLLLIVLFLGVLCAFVHEVVEAVTK